MKTIKIAEATPLQIDYLVAKEEGREDPIYRYAPEPGDKDYEEGADYSHMFYISGPLKMGPYSPSTNHAQGQPILERERPHFCPITYNDEKCWQSWFDDAPYMQSYGPTMLIAGLRCFLVSRLGETAEVPDELNDNHSHL